LCQKFDLDSISWVDFGELDPFDYYQEHKNTPEPKNILSLYNENELKQLYQHCSVYNKDLVTKYLMPLKQVSYSEAESFFEMKGDDSKKIAKRENEIERLSKSKDEKALRKMKLKYGVE
jgi:hypothetical protein